MFMYNVIGNESIVLMQFTCSVVPIYIYIEAHIYEILFHFA